MSSDLSRVSEEALSVFTRGSESFTGACASLGIGCSFVGRGGVSRWLWEVAVRVQPTRVKREVT